MVMCPVCAAGNADTAKFCSECGKALTAEGVPSGNTVRSNVSRTVVMPQETTVANGNTISYMPSPTENTVATDPTIPRGDTAAFPPPRRGGDTVVLDSSRSTSANEATQVGGPMPASLERTVVATPASLPYEPTVRGDLQPPVVPTAEPTLRGNFVTEPTVAAPVTPTTVYTPPLQNFVPPATEPTPSTVPNPLANARPATPPVAEQPGSFPNFQETLNRIQRATPLVPTVRKADILFVVDCTGSMQGEIDAIRDTILDFVTEIERDGIRVRVGLLAFGDRFCGEESFVFRFDGETFTKDATVFRREVSRLRAGGGGDIPESSLDGLLLALRQPFAPDASKVIVLVTDAPPHIPDMEAQSIEQVAAAIQAAGVKQLYLVIRTQDPTSGVYLTLLEGTQGLAFELGSGENFRTRAENFKKTLRALGRTISTGTR